MTVDHGTDRTAAMATLHYTIVEQMGIHLV